LNWVFPSLAGTDFTEFQQRKCTFCIKRNEGEYEVQFEFWKAESADKEIEEIKVERGRGLRSISESGPLDNLSSRSRSRSASRKPQTVRQPIYSVPWDTIDEKEPWTGNQFFGLVQHQRAMRPENFEHVTVQSQHNFEETPESPDTLEHPDILDVTDQDSAVRIVQACKFSVGEREDLNEIKDTKESRHMVINQLVSMILSTKETGDEVTAVSIFADPDVPDPTSTRKTRPS
jgi:hypothetical protein